MTCHLATQHSASRTGAGRAGHVRSTFAVHLERKVPHAPRRSRRCPPPPAAVLQGPAASQPAASNSAAADASQDLDSSSVAPPDHKGPEQIVRSAGAASIQALQVSNVLEALLDLQARQALSPATTAALWEQLAARRGSRSFLQPWATLQGVLTCLVSLTCEQLPHFSPDQLGAVARSSVLVSAATQPFMHALQQQAACLDAAAFSARGLAGLAWAAAAGRRPLSPEFAEHMRSFIRRQEHDWRGCFAGAQPSTVLMLLWALASLQWEPCMQLLDAAAAACLAPGQLGRMSSRSLVTLLWAVAKLGESEELQQTASQELVLRLELQLAQSGALGSATASSRPFPHATAAAAAEEQQEQPPPCPASANDGALEPNKITTSSSSSTSLMAVAATASRLPEQQIWAGGSSNSSSGSRRGCSSTSRRSTSLRHGQLGVRLLATLVWACGKLRHRHERLLQLATELLHDSLAEMTPADTAHMLWGLAQLNFCRPQLLADVGSALEQPGALDAFTGPQLSMTTFGFSTLDYFPGQGCVGLIADACLARKNSLDPHSLGYLLWNMSRMGLVDETFYSAWVPVIRAKVDSFSVRDLANIARVYSRQGTSGGRAQQVLEPDLLDMFQAIAQQVVRKMDSAEMADLMRILNAFQQLGVEDDQLLEAVDDWANARLAALSPQALSLALWSFARLRNRSERLLSTAAACAAAQVSDFTPSQLAKVSWSFASLGYHPGAVLEQAGAVLAQRTADFSDKAASNVLWALATLNERPSAAALDAIALSLASRLRSYSTQALANIAWAFAIFRHTPPPSFLQALGDAAQASVRAFEPQGLSLMTWGLAVLGTRHVGFLLHAVQDCLQRERLREFEAQHLANLVWGMSKTSFHPGPEFLRAFAAEAELRISDFKPQELFNVLHSLGRFKFRSRGLLAAAAREAAQQAFAFSPQELAGSLWAFARLRSTAASSLATAAEQELVTRAHQFEDRHLSLLCWAWAQLRHQPGPEAAAVLLSEVQRRLPDLGPQPLSTLVAALAQLQLPPEADRQLRQGPLGSTLLARTLHLLPQLKSFEFAQLVRGFAALGLDAAGEQLLGPAASQAALQALDAAVSCGPVTASVQLLWAMQQFQRWPEPAFAALCSRLKKTSPGYKFSQDKLALLGQAIQQAGPQQAAKLRQIRTALRLRALDAAQAVSEGRLLEDEEADLEKESDSDGAVLRDGWFDGASELRHSFEW